MSDKPIYRTVDAVDKMRRVDPGLKLYPTYKLGAGRAEYMASRVGEEIPRFAKRK